MEEPADLTTGDFEVLRTPAGGGLFARRALPEGRVLFGADDWTDPEERNSYVDLTPEEIESLPPESRTVFLRFAYNHDPRSVRGTLHPEATRHASNFINHSCEPNLVYDGRDNIVTRRDVARGEELTMDYGTYSFSFDHEFACRCGAATCRGRVTRDDWRTLVQVYRYGFPRFMHPAIREVLGD